MTIIPNELKDKFTKEGRLSLYDYMNFCLYNSKLGYYQIQNSVGKDFTTAPEISQLFGECIGIFFLNSINNFFRENKISFFELGPGKGSLSKDLIRVFKNTKHLKKKFFLIEISDKLILRQKEKLKNEISKNNITWRKQIESLNANSPVFFYCNEFFDAFPIEQFKKVNNLWYKKFVFLNEQGQIDSYFKKTYEKIPQYYSNVKNNSIVEISKSYKKYLKKIFHHIEKYGGIFIFFDYGPFNKSYIDTLQGIFNNIKCNIFDFPCKTDITHHIDFNFIIDYSKEFKIKHFGPITQREFLLRNGILERTKILINSSNSQKKIDELKKGLHRLIDPEQMGEIFKCLIFSNKNIKKILNHE